MRIAGHILVQHAQLAAFLWAQRNFLAAADPPEPGIVAGIEARLHANLDALRIAGAAGWTVLLEQLHADPGSGEVFVAAVLALERGDAAGVAEVARVARQAGAEAGLAGALGWLPKAVIAPSVKAWLASADGVERSLAVAALRAHKIDPAERLAELMADPEPRVRVEAFRIAGELLRRDLQDGVLRGLDDPDPDARFWAGAAALALGRGDEALPVLRAAVQPGSPLALTALRLVLGAVPPKAGRRWLGELEAAHDTRALAVRGLGMTGDRGLVPWLVAAMADPWVAPAAAQAVQELHGPLEDPDDYFFPDSDAASAAYGVDLSARDDRFPVQARFATLAAADTAPRAAG